MGARKVSSGLETVLSRLLAVPFIHRSLTTAAAQAEGRWKPCPRWDPCHAFSGRSVNRIVLPRYFITISLDSVYALLQLAVEVRRHGDRIECKIISSLQPLRPVSSNGIDRLENHAITIGL